MEDNDLKTLTAWFERTGEFMTFFEHANHKMEDWRKELMKQSHAQQKQLDKINVELDKMQAIIADAGLECFKMAAEETNAQGNDYLQGLKHTEQQLLRQIHDHRAELNRVTQHAMTRITQKIADMQTLFEEKSSSQEPALLPVVNQNIDHKNAGKKDTAKKQPLIRRLEWRAVTLTFLTSLITAIVFGLYTNDEYPWEMHQQASGERGAGKVLLNAWPTLTQYEKNKILYRES